MKKTFLVYFATFLAMGLVIQTGPAVAQQANEEPEEVVVVGAPIERHFEGGRSAIGAEIEIIELTRQVSYADLDLSKYADVGVMEQRIETIAKESCIQLNDMFRLEDPASHRSAISHCTKIAVNGAKEELHLAIASAN